jgi:multiple sugar transport system permease protein
MIVEQPRLSRVAVGARSGRLGAVRRRRLAGHALVYLGLVAGAVLFTLPILWMLFTATKTNAQLFKDPESWLPNPVVWTNFYTAWVTRAPFNLYLRNSAFVTGTTVVAQVVSSALVAFAFARVRWVGRDIWFAICLSTLMLPQQVTMIPIFVLFSALGWHNTFLPLVVPALFGHPFYIFLLRQFFLTIPIEFDEAAVVDGARTWHVLLRIVLPLAKPALASAAIFSFVAHWNDFLWPLLYLSDRQLWTLQLGLNNFRGAAGPEWQLTMAASLLIMLPSLAVFFLAQRWFIQGIALTGIKG